MCGFLTQQIMIITATKKQYESMTDVLDRIRHTFGIPETESMTFAGRLDPLATGIVPVLTGDDVHHKDNWIQADKTYRLEVLIGVSTDTGDLLGVITNTKTEIINNETIKKTLESLHGVHQWPYPWFSSRKVNGKPLWQHFKQGSTDITRPIQENTIYAITLHSIRTIKGAAIQHQALAHTEHQQGDFRQDAINQSWQSWLGGSHNYQNILIDVECSSGTYMRTLAEHIGAQIEVPALAYSIKRTAIKGLN